MKNILFLCTGNSARSILAEAYMNAKGAPHWRAYSAGSKPTGAPNPYALRTLSDYGMPAVSPRSKSWDEFAAPEAPIMDVIVTVCDSAAAETCPVWPAQEGRLPKRLHWSFADPAAVEGDDETKRAAFEKTFGEIRLRIEAFLEGSNA
ncbi:MAG: arsenate reductase ArsC [Parvularculaceae bacterium]|nr:arsenate reductase ArsC [Parvularculaceae bacterium]